MLFSGELLKYAARVISDGVHPRTVVDGFELAKNEALTFLKSYAQPANVKYGEEDRERLAAAARTALRTKLQGDMADHLTDIVTDAVLTIRKPGQPVDLHMVERMHMMHRTDRDSRLVRGLVLDHGARHPDMPKLLENCYIMTCNVSLEYEKSEVASSFLYSTAEEREKLVDAERRFTDEKVRQILELKRQVCTPENGKTFVVVNQKGIDPVSLDMFAKEGVIAIRRAKRRNMERLTLACGGVPVNSTDDLDPSVLGTAGRVYEQTLGEDKYTFIEDVENPFSCTILMKGPNQHTIAQIKDAVRDGLRAVANAIADECIVPGAGAFELAAAAHLHEFAKTVKGKAKLGVKAYADAMLVIPKTLAGNSGFDVSDVLLAAQEAADELSVPVGVDVYTGKPCQPVELGIWDNYIVKRQFVALGTVLASQLLLVDEVMRAGRGSRQ